MLAVVRGRRGQRRRLLVVNGLHVFRQRRPAVKCRRADRAAKDHLPDLHDVARAVLFRVPVRDVLLQPRL